MAVDPGPIDPIDEGAFPFLSLAQPFVDLTNSHIADTYPHYDALDVAHQTIAVASDATLFDGEAGGAVDQADGAHAAHASGFEAADPVEVIATSGAQIGAIEANRANYDDPPPAEIPPGVTPPPPSGGGPGGAPPPNLD